MKMSLRGITPAFLGVCLLCLPTAARAANNCPWINEATASGLLGGDAVGAFTPASTGQPAVCTFTQQLSDVTRTLRITMEVVPNPQEELKSITANCGTDPAPIQAIGNEATVCTVDGRKGATGERIVGRVRDQVFTITISTTQKMDSILTRDVLKMNIATAAEQVAGNLF
jgi:hypothetical protein